MYIIPVDEPTRTEITAIETKDVWSLKASRLFPYLEMSFDGFFELYDRIFYGQPHHKTNWAEPIMTSPSATIAARLDRLPKSRYIRNLVVQLSLPAPSLPDRRRQRVRWPQRSPSGVCVHYPDRCNCLAPRPEGSRGGSAVNLSGEVTTPVCLSSLWNLPVRHSSLTVIGIPTCPA